MPDAADRARLGVTTSHRVTEARRAHARSRAEQWGVAYVDRACQSLSLALSRFDALLVFEQAHVNLLDSAGGIRFHAGMAYQRIKRLSRGMADPLVQASGLRVGQRVLDATLGFGQDALVAAAVVGAAGSVTGLEASRVLSAFADAGLAGCALPPGTDLDVTKVVDVVHAEATAWLAATRDRFDVALLDPMFPQPKRAHPSFAMLRRHALPQPLTDALLTAALRRASTVVAKVDGPATLDRLSIRPASVHRTRSAIWTTFGA